MCILAILFLYRNEFIFQDLQINFQDLQIKLSSIVSSVNIPLYQFAAYLYKIIKNNISKIPNYITNRFKLVQ